MITFHYNRFITVAGVSHCSNSSSCCCTNMYARKKKDCVHTICSTHHVRGVRYVVVVGGCSNNSCQLVDIQRYCCCSVSRPRGASHPHSFTHRSISLRLCHSGAPITSIVLLHLDYHSLDHNGGVQQPQQKSDIFVPSSVFFRLNILFVGSVSCPVTMNPADLPIAPMPCAYFSDNKDYNIG